MAGAGRVPQASYGAGGSRRLLLLLVLPLAFLALFFFYPLLSILRLSLSAAGESQPLVLRSILDPLGFTLWQAALSTVLTFAVGLPGAYLFARFDFPGKRLLRALTTLPFVLPTVVVAVAFNALLGPRGWLNLGLMALSGASAPPIQFINTLWAILAAHVFYNTAVVLRLVGNAWAHLDPRLTHAARVLGASPWRAWREVTLPLLRPSILAALVLVFLFDFSSFGVVLMLGGPRFATLEVAIYTQALHLLNLPLAALLSLIQIACTLSLTTLYARLAPQVSAPSAPRAAEEASQRPVAPRRRLAAVLLVGLLLVLLVAPLVALAARSIARLEPDRGQRTSVSAGLTLSYYRELFVNRREALFYVPPIAAVRNSLGYAAATVIIALALGLPAASALARASRFGRQVDALLMLPLGTSAVTLGLGFVVALDTPPLDLRASPLLVPLAHSLVALPFVVRTLQPALASIPERLRMAAATLGASPWRVWREVDLPIVARAASVAAAFAFTISMGEFGATSLVARPEYPTVPVAIFRFLSQPGALNYGQALAMATLLMGLTLAGILVIERLRLPGVGEF
ncbi:MAG: iron ABC transporter permease [Chloroflexi bacterium]|nr:iron ABC transporter permease [Chloroflexota bacterium]